MSPMKRWYCTLFRQCRWKNCYQKIFRRKLNMLIDSNCSKRVLSPATHWSIKSSLSFIFIIARLDLNIKLMDNIFWKEMFDSWRFGYYHKKNLQTSTIFEKWPIPSHRWHHNWCLLSYFFDEYSPCILRNFYQNCWICTERLSEKQKLLNKQRYIAVGVVHKKSPLISWKTERLTNVSSVTSQLMSFILLFWRI